MYERGLRRATNRTTTSGRASPPRRVSAKGGLTALLHAARQGHMEAVAALLDGGADINGTSVSDGTSPLLMAAINGQFDLALSLVERGADPNIASRLNNVTPLWATVNARWQPRTRYPQPQELGLQTATYLDVMKALLQAGADPNVRLTLHPWYMEYSGCGKPQLRLGGHRRSDGVLACGPTRRMWRRCACWSRAALIRTCRPRPRRADGVFRPTSSCVGKTVRNWHPTPPTRSWRTRRSWRC